jgi:hypothetical protein
VRIKERPVTSRKILSHKKSIEAFAASGRRGNTEPKQLKDKCKSEGMQRVGIVLHLFWTVTYTSGGRKDEAYDLEQIQFMLVGGGICHRNVHDRLHSSRWIL